MPTKLSVETYWGDEKDTYSFFRGPSSRALGLDCFRELEVSSEGDPDWRRELLIMEEHLQQLSTGGLCPYLYLLQGIVVNHSVLENVAKKNGSK